MLSVTVHKFGKAVILRCSGRIVRGEETRILCAALSRRNEELILDLSRVHAIDAAGIGALVSLQAAGVYLKIQNPSPRVREILLVTKLDSLIEICFSPTPNEMAAATDVVYAEPELS